MSTETNNNNSKKPDFIAFNVQGEGRNTDWIKLGAAWNHKNGEGITVQLDTLPVQGFNGKIVLRLPKD